MVELTDKQKREFLKIPGFKELLARKMAMKDMKGMKGKGRITDDDIMGSGFWSDLGKKILKTGKSVNKFLRDTKIISKTGKTLEELSGPASFIFGPKVAAAGELAGDIGSVAEMFGYGAGDNKRFGSTVYGGVPNAGGGRVQF